MSARPRNEDLAILDDLDHDLGTAFRRAERVEAARRTRRRLRRVAVATAALFVVVPGAVATRSIWAPDPGVNAGTAFEGTRAIQMADGQTGTLSWRLSAVDSQGGVCWQAAIFTATNSASRGVNCSIDARGAPIGVAATLGDHETFVFGWADPAVERVVVTPQGGVPQTASMVIAPADRAERAGVPAGSRAYVVTFPGDVAEEPILAVAFDAAGRELGRMPPSR